MGTVRTIAVALLILCSAITAGLAAAGSIDRSVTPQFDRGSAVEPQTNGTVNESDVLRNASLGGEISSFMQITAAGAEGAVDSGLWRASLNDTENETERAQMINARIEYLGEREQAIETETAQLRADRTNNTSVSYVARASRLAARIEALRDAVNQTAAVAASENVSEREINRLENESANLSEGAPPAVDETLRPNSTLPIGTPPESVGTPAPTAASTPINGTTTPATDSSSGNATVNDTTPTTNASVDTETPANDTATEVESTTTEETTTSEPSSDTVTTTETAETTTTTTSSDASPTSAPTDTEGETDAEDDETETETETDTESDTEADTQTEDADTATEADTQTEADTATEVETDAETDSGAETDNGTEADTDVETGVETEADGGNESDTESGE